MTRPVKTRSLIVVLALCASMVLAAMPLGVSSADAQDRQLQASGLVVAESARSFEDTWTTLIGALDANPNIRIIAQVDHAASAANAGLTLDNNRVVFFGNPALGTPIMQASRTAGIDLPQKMQVFEHDGAVFVAYNPPTYLAARHQTGDVPTLDVIGGALSGLTRTATQGQVMSAVTAPQPAAGAGLVTTQSANDFETTWSNLIAAIDNSPASVAFTVDHGANSGGSLAPTRLVVFGNPAIGTPIMVDQATAGVDLPLKMLVFEDDAGVTHVVSSSPNYVQARHGVGDVATINGASNAIANFTRAATSGSSGSAGTTEGGPQAPQIAFTGIETDLAVVGFGLVALGGAFVLTGRRRSRN